MADPFYFKCLSCNDESGRCFYGNGRAEPAMRELAQPCIAEAIATLLNHYSEEPPNVLNFEVTFVSGIRTDGNEGEAIRFIAAHAGHSLAICKYGEIIEILGNTINKDEIQVRRGRDKEEHHSSRKH